VPEVSSSFAAPELNETERQSPERSSAAVERALFWIPFVSLIYFYQGADQSTGARFDLMRSILERRTLWIDGYCGYNTADIISFGGHYYSVKAPGGSLTGLLQWLIFTELLRPLMAHHEALYWALASWLTIVFSTSLLVAIAGIVMYRLAIVLGATQARAIASALILPLATIMFPYGTEMTGEPIAGACALISFYLLVMQGRQRDLGRAMFAGMLAGWAVLCDFPAFLIAVAIAVYALVRLRLSKELAGFVIGAAAVATVLLAYNQASFGNPFFLSYEGYKLASNSQFPEQAIGFVGITYPHWDILVQILIAPQRGLFFCNPVLLLSIAGLVAMGRRPNLRAETTLVVFAILSMILFNASFGESIVSWGGGTATGPRQIVAMIPFMVIPLAFLSVRWNWPLIGLALLSVFIMLMATAVEPHFPYEYENPIRDFAWPGYLRGDFAYDRDAFFGGPAIVGESTAFNLGKMARIPAPLQLWPLAALWLIGGIVTLHRADNVKLSRYYWVAIAGGLEFIFVMPLAGAASLGMADNPVHGLHGRYYRELAPNGYPPHVDRIDSVIDFESVAQMGSLPAPSRAIWTGAIHIEKEGVYKFMIEADDLGWLKVDEVPVISDPGNVERERGAGAVYLTAGAHRIEVGERNLAGDAAIRLFWQPPGGAAEIVPSSALSPE
jgi:hypothetical protein